MWWRSPPQQNVIGELFYSREIEFRGSNRVSHDFKVIMEKVFGLAMMLSRGTHFVVTAVGDTGSDRYDQPLS